MDENLPLLSVYLVSVRCNTLIFIGTAVFCQLFGLAPNYTLAIIFRTCWGLMNSMLGVVKTYIAEMCNAHTVAKGFTVMSSAGGLAR